LTAAGVLQVVSERRVRGAVERTYTLRLAAAQVNPDEVALMSRDDHSQAFLAYVVGMLGDFDRYISSERFDPLADGATYRVAGLWFTDTEYADFLRDLSKIVQPGLANPPAKGRRLRLLYHVVLPAPEPPGRARPPSVAKKPKQRAKTKSRAGPP
jgi:hypothetical protein